MRSLECLRLCVAVTGFFSMGVCLRSQEIGGQDGLKENLDLPFNAIARAGEEEEEDAPEIVVLYGQTFEADGFVFLGEGTT